MRRYSLFDRLITEADKALRTVAPGAMQGHRPSPAIPLNEQPLTEEDHLAWCAERVHELGSHTSLLNPLWYALSFGVGAAAGAAGDKWSLGFVAETERQVCDHLQGHLADVPVTDETHAILQQMHHDEAEHMQMAVAAGAAELPAPIKHLMTFMSKVMTSAVYRI